MSKKGIFSRNKSSQVFENRVYDSKVWRLCQKKEKAIKHCLTVVNKEFQ